MVGTYPPLPLSANWSLNKREFRSGRKDPPSRKRLFRLCPSFSLIRWKTVKHQNFFILIIIRRPNQQITIFSACPRLFWKASTEVNLYTLLQNKRLWFGALGDIPVARIIKIFLNLANCFKSYWGRRPTPHPFILQKCAIVSFLDVEEAFDNVCHN